jgi:FkbM family methyltransferase
MESHIFANFTESSTVFNILQYNCDKIHNYYYSKYKFNNSNIFNDTFNDIIINNNQELIMCENFKFCTLKNDTCISDCLRSGKLYEKFLMAFIEQFIPKDKNILDIGANIGVWSIIYSNIINNDCKIYSFEPQKEIFDCLNNNVIINKCNNIVLYNIGLSNENNIKYMNASYDMQQNFGSFRIVDDNDINSKLLKIECKIGDELQYSNIGFIKIDVEGFEYKVLQGLEQTILNNKPIIFIEIHQNDINNAPTMSKLYALGYRKVMKLTHCDYLFTY